MVKSKKKARYVSPRIMGTSSLLSELICASVRFNVRVQELDNINTKTGEEAEPLYFEF